MHRFLLLFIVCLCLTACKNQGSMDTSILKDKSHLADINIVIESKTAIDSIWVADIGQKESQFLPFNDTINVDLKRHISDLYNIYVYKGEERIGTQLWLDGEKLVIDMAFDSKSLTVNNVDSSALYQASIHHTKQYQELVNAKEDSTTIDKFLISEIRDYIDTPLSHAIVNTFLFRNQNNREKVDQVYRIMRMQTDSLKGHLINNTDRMVAILNVEAVKFDKYDLGDIQDQKMNIELDASKQYLLDFWFVRCPPCLRDHKRIAQNYDVFEKNNIQLIGISRDDDYALWKRYLDKHDYQWINVREQKPENRLTYDLSIWSYPTYALIDHKGSIQAHFSSFAQFENYINEK